MRAEEERTQLGAGMERQLNIASAGPIEDVDDVTDGSNFIETGQAVVGAVCVDVSSVVGDRTRGHVDESGQIKAPIIDTTGSASPSGTSSVEDGTMIGMLRVYVRGTVQPRND